MRVRSPTVRPAGTPDRGCADGVEPEPKSQYSDVNGETVAVDCTRIGAAFVTPDSTYRLPAVTVVAPVPSAPLAPTVTLPASARTPPESPLLAPVRRRSPEPRCTTAPAPLSAAPMVSFDDLLNASVAPVSIDTGPGSEPAAPPAPTCSVPSRTCTPPATVLLPESTSVPKPVFATPPEPASTESIVAVLERATEIAFVSADVPPSVIAPPATR